MTIKNVKLEVQRTRDSKIGKTEKSDSNREDKNIKILVKNVKMPSSEVQTNRSRAEALSFGGTSRNKKGDGTQQILNLSTIDKPINEKSADGETKNLNDSKKKGLALIDGYMMEGDMPLFKNQYIRRNVITKYAFATRVGFIPNSSSKVNQDNYILSPCIQGSTVNNFRHFFGVCDGHGQNGHKVSQFIKE